MTLVGSTLHGMTVADGANDLGTIFSFPIAVPEPSALLLAVLPTVGLLTRRFRRPR